MNKDYIVWLVVGSNTATAIVAMLFGYVAGRRRLWW